MVWAGFENVNGYVGEIIGGRFYFPVRKLDQLSKPEMTSPLYLSVNQLLSFRLSRQYLSNSTHDISDALQTSLGAQAQVHSAGVLQIRARCPAVSTETIHQAWKQHQLVKLWWLRGTLHLLAKKNVPLFLSATNSFYRRYFLWYERQGISKNKLQGLLSVIPHILKEKHLSRRGLSAILVPEVGQWAKPLLEHNWGGVIKMAQGLGLVCHSPLSTSETLFMPLQDSLKPKILPKQAIEELARHYLYSYGPASLADFIKFTQFPAAIARQAWLALEKETVSITVDNKILQILAADENPILNITPSDQFIALPLFDPYLLAYKDCSWILPLPYRSWVYRQAGWISAVILNLGKVIATWSYFYRANAKCWDIHLKPLVRWNKNLSKKSLQAIGRLFGVDPHQLLFMLAEKMPNKSSKGS